MIRWGDFGQVSIPLLRRASEIVAHQVKLHGHLIDSPPFTPAAIIGNQAIATGLSIQAQAGPLPAFAGIASRSFLEGYYYCLLERGEVADIAHAFGDLGGATDGTDGTG